MPPKERLSKVRENDVPDHIRQYNLVVESAELNDVRMIHLNFDVQPEYYQEMMDDQSPMALGYTSSFKNVGYDPDARVLGGEIAWKVSCKKGNRRLLKCDVSFYIVYVGLEKVDDEHAIAFLKRVGKFASYPYLRSIVSNVSWNAGAELPALPVLK